MDILPSSGLVRVVELADWLKLDVRTAKKWLAKNQVQTIKPNRYVRTWLVRLEELK